MSQMGRVFIEREQSLNEFSSNEFSLNEFPLNEFSLNEYLNFRRIMGHAP